MGRGILSQISPTPGVDDRHPHTAAGPGESAAETGAQEGEEGHSKAVPVPRDSELVLPLKVA